MRNIPTESTVRARELRRVQTPAERSLWSHLRDRQLEGLKFRRQQPLGNFIVDFFCSSARLVVEIDGDSHAGLVEYDHDRTVWLESQGYEVIRFTNREVRENLTGVLEAILEKCKG
jgi:very-short-patch-repair endonuclease